MISYEIYKITHLISLTLVLIGLVGGLFAFSLQPDLQKPIRRLIFICHGVGLLLLVISGFGLLARLGVFGNIPGWAWAKISIWLFVGALLSLFKRKKIKIPIGILIIVLLVGVAASLAITKAF